MYKEIYMSQVLHVDETLVHVNKDGRKAIYGYIVQEDLIKRIQLFCMNI